MKLRHCSVLLGALVAMRAGADVAVPEALAVATDMQLVLSTHAEGAQVYVCSPDAAWALKGPDAVLFDEKGGQIGKHYAGPSWELSDGSLVTGEAVGKDPGPDATAVPWLLLKVKTNSGKGLLAKAGMAQRIETKGGLPPKESCKPGEETRSVYSATYRFFAVKS
jgi:hypothetical protein